jgi:two-component system NarL family sensor kinase
VLVSTHSQLLERGVSPLKSRQRLRQRLALERVISDLSARLSAAAPERLGSEIHRGLKKVLSLGKADRVYWYENPQGSQAFARKYFVRKRGVAAPPAFISDGDVPWVMERLLRGEPIILRKVADLPEDAFRERQFFEEHRVKSVALIPSSRSAKRKGLLGLASISSERTWADDLVSQLLVLSNVIATCLQGANAQQAQGESEALFRHVFEQSLVGVALESVEGGLSLVNPAFCSMLGYTKQELLRLSCSQISHPEDAEVEKPLFEDLRRGRRSGYQLEKRFFRKDGSEMWGHISISTLKRSASNPPLVIGMVQDVTVRKAAEEQLRTSEARLISTLDALQSHIAILDHTGTIVALNARWDLAAADGINITGIKVGANFFATCDALRGNNASKVREVAEQVRSLLSGMPQRNPLLQQMRTSIGTEAWYEVRVARFEENSLPLVVLSYIDVTEIVRTRHELQRLTGRLIQAHEIERHRISRDLHDDIGQRVSLLSTNLETLSGELSADNRASLSLKAKSLQRQASDLASDIHQLSHELHSSRLQHLGLAAALKELCSKVTAQRQIDVELRTNHLPKNIPQDLALTLFRVAQEALNNVIKHSGARAVLVEAFKVQARVLLRIKDNGIGFDYSRQSSGIGLTSMRERLRLVGGQLLVDSSLNQGTEITAEVYIESASTEPRA